MVTSYVDRVRFRHSNPYGRRRSNLTAGRPTAWVPRGGGRGIANQSHLAGAAPPGPGRPGGLGPVHGAVRAQDLRLVPAVEPSGGRRRGRDSDRPAQARGDDADVRLRPPEEVPGVAQDGRPPRLERLLVRPQGGGRGREPGGGTATHGRSAGRSATAAGRRVRSRGLGGGPGPRPPAGRAADLAGVRAHRARGPVRGGGGRRAGDESGDRVRRAKQGAENASGGDSSVGRARGI
jgi:hypothetical protein